MRYITNGKADVLQEYGQTVYFNVGMPAVVRITHRIDATKKRIKFSRQNVLARDKFCCQYCGAKGPGVELTFDHVVPKSRGGRTEWENIVMACRDCNSKKGNQTPVQAGLRLRTKPYKPSWVPIFNVTLRNLARVPAEWLDYWTAELVP